MPQNNSRFAVVIGSASYIDQAMLYPFRSGREVHAYNVNYQGAVYIAYGAFPSPLKAGDHVVIDRVRPTTAFTIVGVAYGDANNGTPYQNTGFAMSPRDAGTAGTGGTPPMTTNGWLQCDTGPGLDGGRFHP